MITIIKDGEAMISGIRRYGDGTVVQMESESLLCFKLSSYL